MAHRWKFFRAGGFDQVRLESGADLAALPELDPKLWVALACPAKGLELDPHLLALLDTDGDGRVRVPEVLDATTWSCKLLKQPDELLRANTALPLSSIADGTPDGQAVLSSAREILRNLGRPDAVTITAADTADTVKIFASTRFNGDGIIPPESAGDDADTAGALKDILACLGPDKDMSGLDGVSRAKVERFFADAKSFADWWATGEGSTEILALGAATPEAFAACQAVRAKVDDFFARCSLAAMDPSAAKSLNPPESAYQQLAALELSNANAKVAELPIARIEPGRELPLSEGVNPAWAGAVKALREAAVTPLLGAKNTLSAEEWTRLSSRLAAYQAWLATKPPVAVEKLGIARLRALLAGDARAKIDALLAQDVALETAAKAITSVDRLATYYVHLATFLDNFVSFKDFYTRRRKAAFQAGTLYLDGRSCELCLRVGDVGQHAALAPLSMTYLAYCECTRKGTTEKMSIVAAVTGGDSDFLRVGRNGIFYDRKGQDWDATISRVVTQPIGLRQAFWAPYKRAALFISDQIEKVAGARDKEASAQLHGGVQDLATSAVAPPKEDAKPSTFDVAKFAGVFAAIGLAVGMVGSAVAAVVTGFWGLAVWQMPLALAGGLALISGPSLALAAMKLRKRNLAPLLDASGWAINARAAINIPFGGSLTGVAALPPGSDRSLRDPFAQKRRPWGLYLFLLAVAASAIWLWRSGHMAELIQRLHPH